MSTMIYSDFLSHFKIKKQSGAETIAECPLCHQPKLYITETNGKRALFCQHCQDAGPVEEIVQAAGLTMPDLFPETRSTQKPTKIGDREHIYKDSSGNIVAKKTIVKYSDGNKTAFWARYENGRYLQGLKGMIVPLYNADILAKYFNGPILFAEGEKDADTLCKLNFMGTSTPNGANQRTWPETYNDYIRNMDVYILTDNDDAGNGGGEFIAKNIVKAAATVKIIPATAIYADVKAKGDITDIVEAIGPEKAVELLKKAMAAAPQYAAHTLWDEYGFYTYDSLTEADKQPPEFIVDGMIPTGLTFISGPPKTHKSFFALQMAAAIGTGEQFLTHKTIKCGVAYFDLEGKKSRISQRVDSMGIHLPSNVRITHNHEQKSQSKSDKPKLYNLADGSLIKVIRDINAAFPENRVFIIDTYSRARGSRGTGGNNAYDVDVALLEPLQRTALDLNIAIVCIHHDKKGAALVKDSFERVNGTTGLVGSCDSVINLIPDGKRKDGKAKIECTPRDAKGFECALYFATNCLWQLATDTPEQMSNNPIINWIVDNAPSQNKAPVIFSYTEVYNGACKNYSSDNAHKRVRDAITQFKNELYTEKGIAVQMGVQSKQDGDNMRGIRIMTT